MSHWSRTDTTLIIARGLALKKFGKLRNGLCELKCRLPNIESLRRARSGLCDDVSGAGGAVTTSRLIAGVRRKGRPARGDRCRTRDIEGQPQLAALPLGEVQPLRCDLAGG